MITVKTLRSHKYPCGTTLKPIRIRTDILDLIEQHQINNRFLVDGEITQHSVSRIINDTLFKALV